MDELKKRVRTWMVCQSEMDENFKLVYGSAFDLAVDCTADLNLFGYDNPGTTDIPQFVVEIAEEIMGKDIEE